ncbi:MAG TPA: hypothetical protein PLX97_05935 [Gemmatales bacterium]|nr:hypothetical protein [Gemmatales bacterium]
MESINFDIFDLKTLHLPESHHEHLSQLTRNQDGRARLLAAIDHVFAYSNAEYSDDLENAIIAFGEVFSIHRDLLIGSYGHICSRFHLLNQVCARHIVHITGFNIFRIADRLCEHCHVNVQDYVNYRMDANIYYLLQTGMIYSKMLTERYLPQLRDYFMGTSSQQSKLSVLRCIAEHGLVAEYQELVTYLAFNSNFDITSAVMACKALNWSGLLTPEMRPIAIKLQKMNNVIDPKNEITMEDVMRDVAD